jgi:RNA polymerase sigma factor (sigma-70 family)
MTARRKPKTSFPSTRWTDIERWREASGAERRDLLGRFYERYRSPLLWFIRSRGHSEAEAHDILHDFMVSHAEGRIFSSADSDKGRFRNLLLASLQNFMVSRRRAETSRRRQPEKAIESLDDEVIPGLRLSELVSGGATPEQIYEQRWLCALLSNVLDRLREEYRDKDQLSRFELFENRVVRPILQGTEQPSVADLAARLGIDASEASNYIVTAKRGYQRHLQAEVREYVSSEKEAVEEINDLFGFLERLHSGRRAI